MEAERDELAVKLRASEARMQARVEAFDEVVAAHKAETDTLRSRLLAPREPLPTPLVERPWFVATMTIIVTVAIAVPVTWLAVTEASGL